MELFIIDGLKVMPHPSTLLIHPFDRIWESDKSSKKELALAKFAFIEFMCSYKKSNPFIGYNNEVDRAHKISLAIRGIDEKNDLLEDPDVLYGIKVFRELQRESSPTLTYYESAVKAAQKTSEFLKDIDLERIGPKGYPLYKPADITRALVDTDRVLKTLVSMKDKVEREITESEKGKAGRTINFFEKSGNGRENI